MTKGWKALTKGSTVDDLLAGLSDYTGMSNSVRARLSPTQDPELRERETLGEEDAEFLEEVAEHLDSYVTMNPAHLYGAMSGDIRGLAGRIRALTTDTEGGDDG